MMVSLLAAHVAVHLTCSRTATMREATAGSMRGHQVHSVMRLMHALRNGNKAGQDNTRQPESIMKRKEAEHAFTQTCNAAS